MTASDWAALEAHQPQTLSDLFASDAKRVDAMTIEQSGIRFDFSKTHLDDAAMSAFAGLSEAMGLAKAQNALFTGAIVNPTEGRAAEHTAERGNGSFNAVAAARGQIGKPYLWGAGGTSAFDCSGLTSYAWRLAGRGNAG